MTTSIKSGASDGAIQVNGIDAVVYNAGGVTSKIQSITASVAANALTVTLNPCTLDFRSATLTSGAVNTRLINSAISMVVSSGSTLGTVSAQKSRLVVLAIDNAGTTELAIANIAGGVNLDETGVISTTAEGGAGAADTSTVVYSTTARTSVPYRVVGYIESTQATAGTWATAPSTIQGYGGQALAAMSSLGYGQTWQSFSSANRASGTTFYNTTGKPITISVNATGTSSSTIITVNSVQVANQTCGIVGGFNTSASAVVPVGGSYLAIYVPTFGSWNELR